ncbi:MAG: carbohydrate-binding protein [Comamonadaceae bacterium]|nr:MAG: carbohydrate-binding protein [Comamonadaceae bacterium]
MLDSDRGALQPPIRSEIFGPQRFAQHGRSLATTHRAERARIAGSKFFPRLESNIDSLRDAHRYISAQASTGYDISPAAEWLLDNFHLIEAQLKEIRDGLPRSYFRSLPVLVDEPLAGLPRVYSVAWAFVAHTDGAFDDDLLTHFLGAYQGERPLNLSEMWALPTTLRVVLVENLRRLADRVAASKAAREFANLCGDHLEKVSIPDLDEALALLNKRGVGQAFLTQMAQLLQDRGSRTAETAPLHDWLHAALPDLAGAQTQKAADQAADNLSVSNAVKSLRAIGDADWPDIIADTSVLMKLLLASPVFASEDVLTRDQTLHNIERLARRSGHGEVEVARAVLAHTDAAAPGSDEAIAAHWLSGPGRPALMKALGMRESAASSTRTVMHRFALPLYLGSLLLGTLLLVAWVLLRHHASVAGPDGRPWLGLLAAILMAFPASEAVIAVINRLISESARPRHMPRLAFSEGILAEHRVLVVVPCMLTSDAGCEELAHRLELHYLANPERHAQFALLSDWADAKTARVPADDALLASAVVHLNALNVKYPALEGDPPRFQLLHRERSFSETEQCWIGWERKRGKLELLVTALAEASFASFLNMGNLSRVAGGTPYIVTLDADTQLPPGRLRELVGAAAHPHNQPRLAADGLSVESGYGILQPRVATPLPAPRNFTLYHWLFAGQCGVDPYSAATSEVYQDVFGEGTFTGKGLLNVRAMHAVLSGRLPDGKVLSHDLLEGSLARCAAVTDVTVLEDAPFHADVAASRVHRWTRGDWQLLPFLLKPMHWRLRAINRWKMFDNLRRSLVAPASFLLLVLALATGVLSPWTALALLFAAFSAGPLMGSVAGFAPSRDDLARLHFFRQATIDFARAVWAGLWFAAQLLQLSLMAADAIARAVWRMAVSKRHLLEWTTAAAAQASAKTDLNRLLRQHWGAPLAALALAGALLAARTPWPALTVALCALWAASPIWTWWVSRPCPPRRGATLPANDRAYLEGIARDSWRLFERCVNADENHLPPDNLQTAPADMVAHRTSPTNIGLYLLATCCAREFGWLGTSQLLARLEATLGTLATMERYRGHFLNWYDTQTRAPLLPMYVSTVDSGNLCGHLLAVAQACLELARKPEEAASAKRLQAIAHHCEKLAFAPDFSFLYHRKRHLLHIGFRVSEQQLDTGFYDLLASESRLTSLFAIAKGDVPVRHWSSLGRPFYAVGAQAGLRSWSGSMFEYLMPTLVLDEPHGSALHGANIAALREQMDYATAQHVPWGISESAYAGRDHTLAYQYSPQGVPRLAFRRTPAGELVIAPYATALAAQVAPHHASGNFARMEAMGARAHYGFIEALDFTRGRQAGPEAFTPVSTFMAHHQGMSIVALANVLLGCPAQRWGMANAHIEAVSSLLHERAPREVSMLYSPTSVAPPQSSARRLPGLLREVIPGTQAVEPTHVLSNGRYSVTLRANGAGSSRLGQTGITRTRDDALRDQYGSFFYLRWTPPARAAGKTPRLFSITQHPSPDPRAEYKSVYHADRVCYDAAWEDVRAHTTVWVSPEDDVEFRQIDLRNLSAETLDIELISAFEITLSDPRADEAHPAFTNLFLRAEWQPAHEALVFERKPRLVTEKGLQAAHFLADTDTQVVDVRVQTDRAKWIGRNHAPHSPLASFDALPDAGADGAGTLDTGLDPVCALSVRLRIAPGSSARLTFATAASDDAGVLRAVIDKYRQHSHVKRSSMMSATLAGIRLRTLALAPESLAAIQSLTTALVLSVTRPRRDDKADAATIVTDAAADAACDRRLLWRFGISGDRPIVLVTAGAREAVGVIRAMGQALGLWAWGGIACDLVVISTEPVSYQMALYRAIDELREHHGAGVQGASPTSFHLLRADEISAAELGAFKSLARVRIHADGRPLAHHVQAWLDLHEKAFAQRLETSLAEVPARIRRDQAVAVPEGQFSATGEFRFDVNPALRPARPWANVIANASFGTQITEAGGGYSWALNSRMNQLTAWSNDPVADTPAEWFLLQDRKTMEVWNVAPSAWGGGVGAEDVTYRVAHGQGYTLISHRRGELEVAASWCVDPVTSVKQVRLRFVNRGHRTLHLRAAGIAEWMMGDTRASRATVRTASRSQALAAGQLTTLLATQRERAGGFGDGTAFLAVTGDVDGEPDWTCDRRECFDTRGRIALPDAFGQRSGVGLDPCAALSTSLSLTAGQSGEVVFLLGYAQGAEAAKALAAAAASIPARQRIEDVRNRWDALLGATRVATPDPLFDAMVNRWLLYQSVSCRIWAKAGFYQAGGATGFRDQLQDSMALAWAAPSMLRAQIVTCASRQFPEGDVQHWWHAPGGAGVRTHFSDDLAWLPFACTHYLGATGDTTLLDESVPFLEGAQIPEGAEDAYYTPGVSAEAASVYEHAARTIDRSMTAGVHGLPLMGTGDWNDGMNRVGHEGRGESVWLAWFLCLVVEGFAPVARSRGDGERAQRWELAAEGWKKALIGPSWDGQWFKRAFFDDGSPLGTHLNPEAKIDLIAQAWSVISGVASPALQRMALTAVEDHLVDHDAGLLRLLDPPLADAEPSAGYIQAYPPGVRENGGQYSHGGVWALMAQAKYSVENPGSPHADLPYEYFTYLSPAHRTKHPTHGSAYAIEPYVMAGDVYTQEPYVGRGGWSWYTGAAAWLHRAAVESIFGLKQRADVLSFQPCLPSHWPRAEMTLVRDGKSMRFVFLREKADAALAAAGAEGGKLLAVGDSLAWKDLPAQSVHVIVLGVPATEDATAAGTTLQDA